MHWPTTYILHKLCDEVCDYQIPNPNPNPNRILHTTCVSRPRTDMASTHTKAVFRGAGLARARVRVRVQRVVACAPDVAHANTAATHPTAFIHPTASVHPSANVQAGAVVLEGAVIGARVVIGANSIVGEDVQVGEDTHMSFGVRLSNCKVGRRCVFHHGVCIGQDGFGFYFDEDAGRMVKVPQELGVIIGDDVELGANTCVDCGSRRDTVIGNGCKLDNMVQVGHNAQLGENCILCAHVALGGSSSLGERVVMGGKSAVADHVTVAPHSRIAAKAGVIKDIEVPGNDHGGFPATKATLWRKQVAILRRLVARGGVTSESL